MKIAPIVVGFELILGLRQTIRNKLSGLIDNAFRMLRKKYENKGDALVKRSFEHVKAFVSVKKLHR
ncbi:hypothetical protein Dfri01_44070 [Dyadobacter frigoris]|nr:hypothetical protein Dfri01_44070 [Dyadobacter frigoris]